VILIGVLADTQFAEFRKRRAAAKGSALRSSQVPSSAAR